VRNLKSAVLDLMDERATTFDEKKPHPLTAEVEDYLRGLHWVAEAGCRTRDEGHVFHIEAFVVPRKRRLPSLDALEEARDGCAAVDWKVQDVVIVPVSKLPDVV